MANSPVLWGPGASINLQPQELLSNGTLISYNGLKNYIAYGNFENQSTTGWSVGNIGTLTNGLPTGTPTFGSGGAAQQTISINTSFPIYGTASLQFGTSNGLGSTVGDMMATQAYAIDSGDQTKVLAMRLKYKAFLNPGNANWSGTSSNTLAVALWDVTNSAFIPVVGAFNFVQSSGPGDFSATAQIPSTTASVRLCVYNANATGGTYSVLFDDFYLGPQAVISGAVMGDWQSYTPTFTGFGTVASPSFYWRRVGDSVEISGGVTTGTTTAVQAQMTLPAGLTASSSKLNGLTIVGVGAFNAANVDSIYVLATGGNSYVNFGIASSTTAGWAAANGNGFVGNGVGFTIDAKIPISGWSSNAVQSADTDTRIVSFSGTQSASQSLTASSTNVAVTTLIDRAGSWTGSTFTVPVSGDYPISLSAISSATQATLQLYVNGVANAYIGTTSPAAGVVVGGSICYMGAKTGDVLSIRSTVTTNLTSTAIQIFRLSGPAVVQATESVNATYGMTTSQAVGANTVIKYDTKIKDTHLAYSTSTGLFTCCVSGQWRVSMVGNSTAGANPYVKVNGASVGYLNSTNASGQTSGTMSIQVLAGQTIGVYSDAAVTFGGTQAQGFNNQVTFERTGN